MQVYYITEFDESARLFRGGLDSTCGQLATEVGFTHKSLMIAGMNLAADTRLQDTVCFEGSAPSAPIAVSGELHSAKLQLEHCSTGSMACRLQSTVNSMYSLRHVLCKTSKPYSAAAAYKHFAPQHLLQGLQGSGCIWHCFHLLPIAHWAFGAL